MGKITGRDEEHGPNLQVLNGMGDAGWHGESSDHILRDETILSSLLIPRQDAAPTILMKHDRVNPDTHP